MSVKRSGGTVGRRLGACLLAVGALTLALPVAQAAAPSVAPSPSNPTATGGPTPAGGYAATETIGRDNLVNGTDTTLDTRSFSVSVDRTQNLSEREELSVSWTGAHPTGGVAPDVHAQAAAEQEYPVVILQCRGLDSTTVPAAQQLSQSTCWTHTPAERYQADFNNEFPSWRADEYATAADRGPSVGVPNPYPAKCSGGYGVQYWVPFVGADGTVYPGGPNGCAGIPAEASIYEQSSQPASTTYASTGTDGTGSAQFVLQTDESNASLGCNQTTACSLVIIPIEGMSCDPAGADLPASDTADRPPASQVPAVDKLCVGTDHYLPGSPNDGEGQENLSVSGYLWWAASNWRNRISVPLSFGPPPNVCDLANSSQPLYLYGSELMADATSQWAPAFCLNPKLFKFNQVLASEPESKSLLGAGTIEAAIQGEPPPTPFSTPTVQSPIGVSGFAVAYDINASNGHRYGELRLTPRLLAKLLTESYPATNTLQQTETTLTKNPQNITLDPEFQALNPGIASNNYDPASAALFTLSSDSDAIYALTSYINADPAARAWLDGAADPWGMVVNPTYKKISLPVTNWPLLDNFTSPGTGVYSATNNPCLFYNPVPFLPLVEAPTDNMATVTQNLQFDVANSQIVCQNAGSQNEKLVAEGVQPAGQQFVIGVVPYSDAVKYDLPTAALQSQVSPAAPVKFTDAEGRSFVAPSAASITAAAPLFTANADAATWTVDYSRFQTDPSAAAAYPGTMLFSADVPTTGLASTDASRYATLLSFAALAGQVQGSANGQLAPGYVPMTAANGFGAEAAYGLVAAQAVAGQTGVVPPLTPVAATPSTPAAAAASPATAAQPTSGSDGSSSGGSFQGSSSGDFGGSSGVSPAAEAPPGASGSATGSAATQTAPIASALPVAKRLRTPALSSGWAATVIPAALLLALVALVAAGLSFVPSGFMPGRRRR